MFSSAHSWWFSAEIVIGPSVLLFFVLVLFFCSLMSLHVALPAVSSVALLKFYALGKWSLSILFYQCFL